MAIISLKNQFIFIKTRKVAGTSVEVALRRYCGPDDIITCITPRDEYVAASQGLFSRNYAVRKEDEELYTELVLAKKFEEALEHLKMIPTKFKSHIPAKLVRQEVSMLGLDFDDFYTFSIDRHPYSWILSKALYNNTLYNKGVVNTLNIKEATLKIDELISNSGFTSKANWNSYTDNNKIIVKNVIKYENIENEMQNILRHLCLDRELFTLPDLKNNSREIEVDSVLNQRQKSIIYEKLKHVFTSLKYEP